MINLLIMDDEEIIVDGLFWLLDKEKYRSLKIYKAYYADEGLDIIRNHAIDIVLSDISMPGMSGLELFDTVNRMKLNVKFIFLTAHDNFSYIQTALRSGGFDYILKTEPDEVITAAVDRVIDKIEQEREEEASEILIDSDDDGLNTKAYNHIIDYVNKYINEHINEDISVNRLSELVYLNPSYFSRLYKQSTGIPVTHYIAEVKLEYAKRMLKDSNMKINQIAEKLGFDSVSYFIRFFKKYMKYSPQDYRNKR